MKWKLSEVNKSKLTDLQIERYETAVQLTKLYSHTALYRNMALPITTSMDYALLQQVSKYDSLTSQLKGRSIIVAFDPGDTIGWSTVIT